MKDESGWSRKSYGETSHGNRRHQEDSRDYMHPNTALKHIARTSRRQPGKVRLPLTVNTSHQGVYSEDQHRLPIPRSNQSISRRYGEKTHAELSHRRTDQRIQPHSNQRVSSLPIPNNGEQSYQNQQRDQYDGKYNGTSHPVSLLRQPALPTSNCSHLTTDEYINRVPYTEKINSTIQPQALLKLPTPIPIPTPFFYPTLKNDQSEKVNLISQQEMENKREDSQSFTSITKNTVISNDKKSNVGSDRQIERSDRQEESSSKLLNKTKVIKEEEELYEKNKLTLKVNEGNDAANIVTTDVVYNANEKYGDKNKSGQGTKDKSKVKNAKEKKKKSGKKTKGKKNKKVIKKKEKKNKGELKTSGWSDWSNLDTCGWTDWDCSDCDWSDWGDWDGASFWGRLMNGIRKETCEELMNRIIERTVYATPTFADTLLESPFTEVCLDKFIQADDEQDSLVTRSFENMKDAPNELLFVENEDVVTPPAGMNVKLFCNVCNKFESKSCV